MNQIKIHSISKVLLVVAALLLIISIFVPLWSINLDAPQYPEGLRMLICPNGVKGDVDIINGLNHYIGMKTIHNEDFIEFKILPYLIGFFALLTLVVALIGRKKPVYILFTLFVLFGIVAMYDFWKWEYDYGHNLDPNAAIIVPGMAYQPPLIGFKQLLNFGAYSVPALGGWLFITSGLLMLLSGLIEMNVFKRFLTSGTSTATTILLILLLSSCGNQDAEPIKINRDACDFCKMTISNGHFGAELKTSKGRAYKFDDISCMLGYVKEHSGDIVAKYYVHDYPGTNDLIDAETAYYLTSPELKSPMGGNTAAFKSADAAASVKATYQATETSWNELKK